MIHSVFVKTYLQMSVLFIGTFIALIIVLGHLLEEVYVEEFQTYANAEAEAVINRLNRSDPMQWQQVMEDYRMVLPLKIIGIQETLTNDWKSIYNNPDLYFNDRDAEAWQIARRINDSTQYLQLSEIIEPTNPIDTLEFFVPLMLLFAIFAFGFYRLSRKIEQPVHAITRGTVALAEGVFTTRLVEGNFDEPFHTLSQRFNAMAEKIEQLVKDQQIMVSAVPHELRSPLARIRFALDLTRSIQSLPELQSRIEKIDYHVDTLEATINDTLALSRIQLKEKVSFQPILLEDIINQLVDEHISDKAISYSTHFDQTINGQVFGDELLLKRAIGNLLENAKRHTHSKIPIDVHQSGEKHLKITVADDGSGIPPSEQQLLFSPFSRIDKSRSRAIGGVGLGLALAELIMRKHGGTASYQSSELGGAAFVLQWPAMSKKPKSPS
jgi:two-component system, OmpR family, sensor histidine kinase RstB